MRGFLDQTPSLEEKERVSLTFANVKRETHCAWDTFDIAERVDVYGIGFIMLIILLLAESI